MNLQEFIDLRTHCPMCGTALITKFISDRKQRARLEEDRFVSVLTMRGMRSCEPSNDVGYSFGLNDNSFVVDFYKDWERAQYITNYARKSFVKFHENIGKAGYRFIRTCGFCFKYEMVSSTLFVSLKEGTYGSIIKQTESFLFMYPLEIDFIYDRDIEHKYVRLDNHHQWGSSDLWWFRSPLNYRLEWSMKSDCSHRFDLPMIPFVSKENTGTRLTNLITFA